MRYGRLVIGWISDEGEPDGVVMRLTETGEVWAQTSRRCSKMFHRVGCCGPMSRPNDRSRRVARYVAARRNQLGLSQDALADQAGLNPKTLSTLENGKHWPSARTRRLLEPLLGWDEGDIQQIADGGFPATGPLSEDDPDGAIAAAAHGRPAPDNSSDFEKRVRAVISDLPERYRPLVEELYEQLQDAERRNRRLMDKIVPLPARDSQTGASSPEPPDDDGAVGL